MGKLLKYDRKFFIFEQRPKEKQLIMSSKRVPQILKPRQISCSRGKCLKTARQNFSPSSIKGMSDTNGAYDTILIFRVQRSFRIKKELLKKRSFEKTI